MCQANSGRRDNTYRRNRQLSRSNVKEKREKEKRVEGKKEEEKKEEEKDEGKALVRGAMRQLQNCKN